MTCIVAIKSKGIIYMGGDSFSGNSSYQLHLLTPKVIRKEFDGQVALMGHSGTHRGGNLLNMFEFPSFDPAIELTEWVNVNFVNELRTFLKDSGYLKIDNSVEEYAGDMSFLLGIDERIFSIWDSFSVVETEDPYMAIGSGMYFALGALYTLCTQDESPRDSVELALKAAERHNPFVSGPFHIISSLP